mgnify:CR=1 FL=1
MEEKINKLLQGQAVMQNQLTEISKQKNDHEKRIRSLEKKFWTSKKLFLDVQRLLDKVQPFQQRVAVPTVFNRFNGVTAIGRSWDGRGTVIRQSSDGRRPLIKKESLLVFNIKVFNIQPYIFYFFILFILLIVTCLLY